MGVLVVRTCPICHREYATDRDARTCSGKCSKRADTARRRGCYAKGPRAGNVYKFAGYHARHDTPVEDYEDFRGLPLSRIEVAEMLDKGYFPPGLQLRCGDVVFEVMGSQLHKQELKLYQEAR